MGDDGRVGVAVIGAGAMGSDHARDIAAAVSGARVVAVADVDGARAQELADEIDARAFDDASAAIKDPRVDAVVVAAHDSAHVELVLRCLDLGKPVLCEKPLSLDLEGCRKIVSHQRADLVSVGFSRRFGPSPVDLKAQLHGGAIGAPPLVHAVHRNMSTYPRGYSASTIYDSGIHELDQMPWLLDQRLAAVSWIAPASTSKLPDRQDPADVPAPDHRGSAGDRGGVRPRDAGDRSRDGCGRPSGHLGR